MKMNELTDLIKVKLETLTWLTDDKRFDYMYPYAVAPDKAEWDPYLYFVMSEWDNSTGSSLENQITVEYWFYIVRNYDTDRYKTELAIQKDFEEIWWLFLNKEQVFPWILDIKLEDFYIDDSSSDTWNSKIWALFLSFTYMVCIDE